MGKRLLMLLTCLTGLALVGGLAFWWTVPGTAITRANYDRIQVGMTRQEVDDIMGGPPRNEATDAQFVSMWEIEKDGSLVEVDRRYAIMVDRHTRHGFYKMHGLGYGRWVNDQINVWVFFDPQGRVQKKEGQVLDCRTIPPWTRLRKWIGR